MIMHGTLTNYNNSTNNGHISQGFGLFYFSNANCTIPINRNLPISNGSFYGYLTITNGMIKDYDFLVLALDDYKVVPFEYNGIISTNHSITVPSMTSYIGPFSISNISNGSHDIALIAFPNYDNHSLDSAYRLHSDYFMGGRRFYVINGDDRGHNISYSNFTEVKNNPSGFDGVILTDNFLSMKPILTQNVRGGQIFNYNISVGNANNMRKKFVIIQLLDYNQVPIKYDSFDLVIYGSLDGGDKCSIPASVRVPDGAGVHELIVILTTEPYEKIEESHYSQNTTIFPHIESSIRIGLNVTG